MGVVRRKDRKHRDKHDYSWSQDGTVTLMQFVQGISPVRKPRILSHQLRKEKHGWLPGTESAAMNSSDNRSC